MYEFQMSVIVFFWLLFNESESCRSIIITCLIIDVDREDFDLWSLITWNRSSIFCEPITVSDEVYIPFFVIVDLGVGFDEFVDEDLSLITLTTIFCVLEFFWII